MKKLNKTLSLILCVSMVLNFALPNFATGNDNLESTSIDTTLSSSDLILMKMMVMLLKKKMILKH